MTEKILTPSLLAEVGERLAAEQPRQKNVRLHDAMAVLVEGQRCVKIPLTKGMFAIVDEDDAARILTRNWCAQGKPPYFYAYRKEVQDCKSKSILMHRFIAGFPDALVDHHNGNGLDNRKQNLRIATRQQNNANKLRRWGKSKFKGVRQRRGKWGASITVNAVKHWLGTFSTENDAARAFDIAAVSAFGEFAVLNFPVR